MGKTVLTLALARSLMNRGMRVRCFKVGPDFIDPGFHTAVTGRDCINLDGWMMGRQACIDTVARHCADTEVVLVEGVMGLYDGFDGTGEDGSTAQIAKWLDLPAVLVIDGQSLARTAGAIALGLQAFDRELAVAGVLFNRVAGPRHFDHVRDGVRCGGALPVFGYVSPDEQWQVPERHLGLVTAGEIASLHRRVSAWCGRFEKTVSVEAILDACGVIACPSAAAPGGPAGGRVKARIGIARDAAFCFYYRDNLDLLERFGAELVFFSPLDEQRLPPDLDGLYLGGGYPELHVRRLSENEPMRSAISRFCSSGRPVYAECGGFLYLLESIRDTRGTAYPLAGVFPARAVMNDRRVRLGYVEVRTGPGCPFADEGAVLRGHEFHYSDITEMPASVERCYGMYRRKTGARVTEGYCSGAVLASYVHLHFASCPDFALRFVERCAREGRSVRGE